MDNLLRDRLDLCHGCREELIFEKVYDKNGMAGLSKLCRYKRGARKTPLVVLFLQCLNPTIIPQMKKVSTQ